MENTCEGTLIEETDRSAHDPMIGYGVAFVFSNHEGPFKSARISTNDAARYGTFNKNETSKNGDTTNADALITHNGHPLDVLCTPTTGDASFETCKSA